MEKQQLEQEQLIKQAFAAYCREEWADVVEILSSECLASHPQYPMLLCDRAVANMKLDFARQAVNDCKAAIIAKPDLALAYLRLGDAWAKENTKKAVRAWKAGLLHANNDFETMKQMVARIMYAENGAPAASAEATASQSAPVSAAPKETKKQVSAPPKAAAKTQPTPKSASPAAGTPSGATQKNPKPEPKAQSSPKSKKQKGKKQQQPQQKQQPKKATTEAPKPDKPTPAPKEGSGSALASLASDPRVSLGDGQMKRKAVLNVPPHIIRKIAETLGHSDLFQDNDPLTLEISLEQVPLDEKSLKACKNPVLSRYIMIGNLLVNNRHLAEGVELFAKIIKQEPDSAVALVGRGTGYALMNDLGSAIKDFTSAISADPTYSDAYLRRAQARVAMNDVAGGISDNSAAILLMQKNPTDNHDALMMALMTRGQLYNKDRDYANASKDLGIVVREQPENAEAWSSLAYSKTAQGDISDGITCYLRVIGLKRANKEVYTNLGVCWGQRACYKKALEAYDDALRIDPRYTEALSQKLSLCFLSGQHRNMLEFAKDAMKLAPQEPEVLRYLPMVLHGMGRYRDAVFYYDIVSKIDPKFVTCYQRDYALFLHHHLGDSFADYYPDALLGPVFKECWCKAEPFSKATGNGYKKQPATFLKNVQDIPLSCTATGPMAQLLAASHDVGSQMQYSASGFLTNTRHQRVAGLAAIHAGQRLCSTVSGTSGGDVATAAAALPWRSFFETMVKWRQIYEPTDSVWWVDQLTPKQFREGFGSCTAMIVGQSKVTRYAPMIERSLGIMRTLLVSTGAWLQGALRPKVYTREQVDAARTPEDLLRLVGSDFWVCTPCRSSADPSVVYEGTRLTIQAFRPHGVDFAIRSACTPTRWKQFAAELDAAWAEVLRCASAAPTPAPASEDAAAAGDEEAKDATDATEAKICAMMKVLFYWYNFMPLSRGTAAVGFMALLAMTMALFGVRLETPLPAGLQLDWEAILEESCAAFTAKVRSLWFDAALRAAQEGGRAYLDTVPSVESVVKTLRDAVVCVNATF